MKLLIFSDSHKTQRHMVQAVRQESPDAVVHLGDHEQDAQKLIAQYPHLPLYQVCGNCDAGVSPAVRLLNLEGVRLFLTHGHLYGVKSGLLRAELAAREQQADVLLFGHTHRSFCAQKDGLWLLNPGTCGGRSPTYGVVNLSNGQADCHLVGIPSDFPVF